MSMKRTSFINKSLVQEARLNKYKKAMPLQIHSLFAFLF